MPPLSRSRISVAERPARSKNAAVRSIGTQRADRLIAVLRPNVGLVLAAVAVVLAAGLLVVAPRLSQDGSVVRTTPSVVTAVRDLARLEAIEFHVERVIDLRDRQSLLFGLIKTQDAIL